MLYTTNNKIICNASTFLSVLTIIFGFSLLILIFCSTITDVSSSVVVTNSDDHLFCDDATANAVLIRIELVTDKYPAETNWNIKNLINSDIVQSGGPYKEQLTLHNETYCVSLNDCLQFTIFDSFRDGICCEGYQGNGSYKLYYDGNVIEAGGDFGYSETSKKFGGGCRSTSSTEGEETIMPYASDPEDLNLQYFGEGPHSCLLSECAGHCNDDFDCADGLFCFHPPRDGMDTVPGCKTASFKDVKYCISRQFMHHSLKPVSKAYPLNNIATEKTNQINESSRRETEDQCPVGVQDRTSTTTPTDTNKEEGFFTTEVQFKIALFLFVLSLITVVVLIARLFMMAFSMD